MLRTDNGRRRRTRDASSCFLIDLDCYLSISSALVDGKGKQANKAKSGECSQLFTLRSIKPSAYQDGNTVQQQAMAKVLTARALTLLSDITAPARLRSSTCEPADTPFHAHPDSSMPISNAYHPPPPVSATATALSIYPGNTLSPGRR